MGAHENKKKEKHKGRELERWLERWLERVAVSGLKKKFEGRQDGAARCAG